MNKKLVKDIIKKRNEKALFLEEKFDDALIGTAIHCGKTHVAAYDSERCLDILMSTMNIGEEEALEEFQETSEKAFHSENKPIFVSDFSKAKEPKNLNKIDINKTLDEYLKK